MTTEAAPTTPKLKRRWLQYSLRTLLVVVTLFAILCSWLTVKTRRIQRQQKAVAAILKMGGQVEYDYQIDSAYRPIPNGTPPGPALLRRFLGDDFFAHIVDFGVQSDEFTDALLEDIIPQDKLRHIHIRSINVTDAGLRHIGKMTHLRALCLWHTSITDAGLEYLNGMTGLDALDLMDNKITAAGMKRFNRLEQLHYLALGYNPPTSAEEAKISEELTKLQINR